jgi:hypothetical protein
MIQFAHPVCLKKTNLPEITSRAAPTESKSSFIQHSLADSLASTFNPHEVPLPILGGVPFSLLENDATSFVIEGKSIHLGQMTQEERERASYEISTMHSVQPIFSTIGAGVMAFLLVLSWRFIPTPLKTTAKLIGVSCALTGFLWCLLSPKTRGKIFIANLILFILSVM